MQEPSLYHRLGGYDKIAGIIDDLFALLFTDVRLARFATGRSIDSNRRVRQLVLDQVCSLSGGPCYYTGRDMKTSHAGLAITESEWTTSLELTREALHKNGVAGGDLTEFLSLFERYRDDIVEDGGRPDDAVNR